MVAGWGAVMTARGAWRHCWRAARSHRLPDHRRYVVFYRQATNCLNARDEAMARAPESTDSLDLRITVRGWDTWDTPVGHDRRPRYLRGGPL